MSRRRPPMPPVVLPPAIQRPFSIKIEPSYEYLIRYRPADLSAWEAFVARLDNPTSVDGWQSFRVSLTERGVSPLDYGHSPAAAVAFRRVVDEALLHGHAVVIEEAG